MKNVSPNLGFTIYLAYIYPLHRKDTIYFIQIINDAVNLAGGFYAVLNILIRKVPIFTFDLIYGIDLWPIIFKIGSSEFISKVQRSSIHVCLCKKV